MNSLSDSTNGSTARHLWKKVAEKPATKERPLSAPLRCFIPNMRSLHMASQHRVGCTQRRAPKKGLSVARSRSYAKSASTARSVSAVSHYDDATSMTTESDVFLTTAELDKFYLEDDDEYDIPVKSPYDTCQQLYISACKHLSIPPATTCLNGLPGQEIRLASHGLGVTGAKACAIALTSNCSVEALDLGDNALGTEGTSFITQMLSANDTITVVSFADNDIGSEGLQLVCDMLKINQNITRVDLSGNALDETSGLIIADMLSKNFTLKELILHHNNFSIAGAKVLACALECNDNLEVLDLSWNHIRLDGAEALANALQRNIGLKSLLLGYNGFSLCGCKALSNSLKKNVTLKNLDLTNNRIDQECINQLIKGLKKNSSLDSLHIAENPFTIDTCKSILDMIAKTPSSSLKFVDISSQSVDVEFTKQLREIETSRLFSMRHGTVIRPELALDSGEDQQAIFNDEDPMMVLMEYMRLNNFRLVDLFTSLDQDNSWSLSRQEVRIGLQQANVPLSEAAIDKLISRLDADGDGEVDFQELVAGQKDHRRKVTRIKSLRKDSADYRNSELGRITEKLQMMMSFKFFKKRRESYKHKKPTDTTDDVQDEQETAAEDSMAKLVIGAMSKKNKLTPIPEPPSKQKSSSQNVFTQMAVLQR